MSGDEVINGIVERWATAKADGYESDFEMHGNLAHWKVKNRDGRVIHAGHTDAGSLAYAMAIVLKKLYP